MRVCACVLAYKCTDIDVYISHMTHGVRSCSGVAADTVVLQRIGVLVAVHQEQDD